MKVRVLYFAVIRERLHKSFEEVELAPGASLGDLLRWLGAQHGEALVSLLPILRIAINESLVERGAEQALAEGDEVALIPPVSGGGGARCRLSQEPLSLDEVVRAVAGEARGGLVTFTGVVRGVSRGRRVLRLEYEAYGSMALRTMEALIGEIERDLPGVRVAIVHRTGVLQVGEAAVVIAAAAAHRKEAFVACQQAIDQLKERVPIWKKEVYEGGEEWIGSGP